MTADGDVKSLSIHPLLSLLAVFSHSHRKDTIPMCDPDHLKQGMKIFPSTDDCCPEHQIFPDSLFHANDRENEGLLNHVLVMSPQSRLFCHTLCVYVALFSAWADLLICFSLSLSFHWLTERERVK